MKRIVLSAVMTIVTLVAIPSVAFAHVVVTPSQATIGSRVLFNISVPNEKNIAVTSVTLAIPVGLNDVQPNVLGGWNVTTTTDKGAVTSITWTGNIPAGQRADLLFKAQTPVVATELDWKAHQTYADGTVVNWDQKPVENPVETSSGSGPYSVTTVVDDLGSTTTKTASQNLPIFSIIVSVFAILLSVVSILIRKRK